MTGIVFFSVADQKILQTLELPKGGCTFKGIGWSSNDKKVWITDEKGYLRSAKMNDKGSFGWSDEILLPGPDKTGSYPGGFAIDERQGLIYVALNRNNTVGIVDMKSGKLEAQIPVGVAPYSIVIKNNKAYVTNWGGRRAVAGDMSAPSSGTPVVIDKSNGVASTGTVSVVDLFPGNWCRK